MNATNKLILRNVSLKKGLQFSEEFGVVDRKYNFKIAFLNFTDDKCNKHFFFNFSVMFLLTLRFYIRL